MAKIAQEAQDLHSQDLAARAAAADTAATLQAPQETESSTQRTAGDLLQQQLQLLTVDSHEPEAILLSQLLKACVVTLGHMILFQTTHKATDAIWGSKGAVAGISGSCATRAAILSSWSGNLCT